MRALKEVADRVLALFGFILFFPIMVLLGAMIWWQMGMPVLFRQARPGKDGKVFTLCKFRTMREAIDANGKPLPDKDRLTPIGKFLRASSLDELPQLWNVVKGEMSLVGPRPLLVEYLDRYSPTQARRHEVKPGITGWAQVNGRNSVDWDDRLAMDVWYVDHWSPVLDLKILFMTISKVLKRDGVSAKGEATMAEFQGSGRSQG